MKDYIAAHAFSIYNWSQLKIEQQCGCFFCRSIFNSKEITSYLSEGTALCPYCGIDSVIGESSGFPITEKLLAEMQSYWF